MINKFRIIILILLFAVINTQCQDMKKSKSIDLSQSTIKIDSCGLYYKGKRLDLGTPIADWEKVLGKPSRDNSLAFVWDDLGIAIDDWQNEKGKVAAIYIFFLNLDSKEGGAGELNHARGWSKFDEKNWDAVYLKDNEKRLKDENDPKNFVYPFTVYNGNVNLHGFPVGKGMKVDEINNYRENLPFSGKFGYVDDDIDGVNDSGNTTDTFGGDYRAGGTECKDNRLQYYEVTYTASGSLEYLKIGYENLTDFKNRKERNERHKKEEALTKNKK
jgi:hypothetical protein